MSGTLWTELAGMALRYLAPVLVGLLAHWLTEKDQARLMEIFTSKEFIAMAAASLAALGFGFQAWLKKTRFGLTAAAMPTTASVDDVKASMGRAPSLATPPNEVPQLTERRMSSTDSAPSQPVERRKEP